MSIFLYLIADKTRMALIRAHTSSTTKWTVSLEHQGSVDAYTTTTMASWLAYSLQLIINLFDVSN